MQRMHAYVLSDDPYHLKLEVIDDKIAIRLQQQGLINDSLNQYSKCSILGKFVIFVVKFAIGETDSSVQMKALKYKTLSANSAYQNSTYDG